jgi:DNA-directed RNA polymerase specialized sigma24 family protein
MALNTNTVKVRLFRARGRLMEVYRRRLKEVPAKAARKRG